MAAEDRAGFRSSVTGSLGSEALANALVVHLDTITRHGQGAPCEALRRDAGPSRGSRSFEAGVERSGLMWTALCFDLGRGRGARVGVAGLEHSQETSVRFRVCVHEF